MPVPFADLQLQYQTIKSEIDGAIACVIRDNAFIRGPYVDAFEREPVPADHPLWTFPNVLLTPHIAAFGSDYWKPAVDLFLENVARFTAGQPLKNLVDKRSGY